MAVVQTIAGPVDSAALGRTLAHEHICSGMAGMERVGMFDLNDVTRRAVAALANARDVGIQTVIDCSPLDLGRQATLFERLARESSSNVIACTGVYRYVPSSYAGWNVDVLAEYFLRDLRHGMEGTKIRAGVLKIAWDYEYRVDDGPAAPRAQLEQCARAAALAAKTAGVPILVHHRCEDRTGHRVLDIFEEEGVDLRAVTVGHCNDSLDKDYVIGLARRGATVGLDRFNPNRSQAELERRAQLALDVIKAGYASHMTLSHDRAAFSINGGPPEGGPRPEDPDCYVRVSQQEIPWLLEHGATDADIQATLVGSVRAMFEAASAMKRS